MTLDIDLAPTFLDLAGRADSEAYAGEESAALAKTSDPSSRTEWYYEYYEWPNPEKVPPNRGIRTERYKLIQYVWGRRSLNSTIWRKIQGKTRNLYGNPQHAALQRDLFARMQALRAQIPEKNA